MDVYVVGAGAIGTYLGEALGAAGCNVTYAPRELDDVRPVAADLAIVTVKAFDTVRAIETLRRALPGSADAAILTPQNGVGNEERLAAAFGADRIVSGALTVPVERLPGGRVEAANRGGLVLAPVGAVAHNWLLATFGRTSIPISVSGDYRSLKWSKLALNLIANAACAILDELPQELVRSNAAFGLELRALREVRAVMRALDVRAVDLPRYPVRALFAALALPDAATRAVLTRRIAGARGAKPPSMLLDLRGGRGRTEVDVLNGAVASAAAARGVSAPVNAAYTRILNELSADPERRRAYRGRPDALVAAVEAEASPAAN